MKRLGRKKKATRKLSPRATANSQASSPESGLCSPETTTQSKTATIVTAEQTSPSHLPISILTFISSHHTLPYKSNLSEIVS